MATVRFAWLLALGRITVVAFFALFCSSSPALDPQERRCDEALAMALEIGSVISFAGVLMASLAGETAALGCTRPNCC